DAGNGAGGFYARDVLAPLGADITGSQFLEPDGNFPNHIPNPEAPEAMEAVRSAAVRNNADLGIIFDTDVDRAGCVDSRGTEINRNRLVALASAIALENCPGGTIVTDSITSDGLKEFIEGVLGGKHFRYKRGYRNVIDKAVELNAQGIQCPLAIETSGHAALKENYFLDDGAYLITKIIIKMIKLKNVGSSLDELTAPLREPLEAKEIRIKILPEDFAAEGKKVIDELTAFAEQTEGWNVAPDNREGIRVSFDDFWAKGWFLLRLSVHDPILPVNIESDTRGGVEIIEHKLCDFLSRYSDTLDLSPFNIT
ncbi:MAG: phosphomannomutase/phosphoglucomutase, partial [Clostridia bacterium]|nr:phosphomannomutase/phosphoglucomutase [Clostridia bacterium]